MTCCCKLRHDLTVILANISHKNNKYIKHWLKSNMNSGVLEKEKNTGHRKSNNVFKILKEKAMQ